MGEAHRFTDTKMIVRLRTDWLRLLGLSVLRSGLAAAGLMWVPIVLGEAAAGGNPELPLITRSSEVFNIAGQAGSHRYRFRIDAIVNDYDPLWYQFFGEDDSGTFFMTPPADRRFPIRPGEYVRLTGELVPNNGFRPDNLEVQVLGQTDGMEVLSAHNRLGDRAALNEHRIEIEGLVDWQESLDLNHQRLSLVAEGRRINVTVYFDVAGQAPLLAGAIVRARGVYLGRMDIDNRLRSIDLNVQGAENLRILGWLDKDPRFDRPAVRISDLGRLSAGAEAHVAGLVTSFAPGRAVTIRDDSGLLELRTAQERNLHIGAEIDAIGIRSAEGGELRLEQALWRLKTGAATNTTQASGEAVLSLAADVLELPAEQAAARKPVKLSGVVTWGAGYANFFFLQDRSGGVRVNFSPLLGISQFSAGLGVTVTGVSAMGAFAPEVIAARIDGAGAMSPPEPQRITLEEAQTGANEARWVEMEGYVRGVENASPWTQLDLTTSGGEFRAMLWQTANVEDKIGAFIRIRGVCDAIANEYHRSSGVQVWVPIESPIEVDEAPMRDLHAIPFTPLDSIGRFGPQQGHTHWLHTAGTATYHVPGRFLVLQSGRARLLVLSRDSSAFAPGDQVDAVGIPGWDPTRFVLREAVIRKVGHEPEPQPVPLKSPIQLTEASDLRLVRVDGVLTEATDLGDEDYLSIRNGKDNVVARIAHVFCPQLPPSWRKGSDVAATGVYFLHFDENRKATGMELLMRSPADLAILKSPPWWTVERALAAAGILGACALIVIVWVASLHRQVTEQTEQIRRQLEKQTRLETELERAQRLHSLGLLAGGIAHDFNNLLAIIMGNLSLAKHDQVSMSRIGDCLRDAENASKRARGLTQQMLTFAKGADPVREALSLPAAVNEAAALALSGSNLRIEFNPPSDLWPVHADRGQLERALQNIVANASAAMPDGGTINLEAANETVAETATRPLAPGRYVRLSVADHGPGIPPEQLPGIFDPYAAIQFGSGQFGLAAAYSIMKRHGGLIEVDSKPGRGTSIRLWIPAAEPPLPATVK
jgi:signal transduction histidine kinase